MTARARLGAHGGAHGLLMHMSLAARRLDAAFAFRVFQAATEENMYGVNKLDLDTSASATCLAGRLPSAYGSRCGVGECLSAQIGALRPALGALSGKDRLWEAWTSLPASATSPLFP